MILETNSERETINIGYEIGMTAKPGEIYCLSGDLGAGKTAFAKGFAKALDIDEHITSPTFAIVNVYEGKLNLYHFDMYRIEDADEIYNTGFEDFFYGQGVCLVEWPEMVEEVIPPYAKRIHIKKDYSKGENYRIIKIIEPDRA